MLTDMKRMATPVTAVGNTVCHKMTLCTQSGGDGVEGELDVNFQQMKREEIL